MVFESLIKTKCNKSSRNRPNGQKKETTITVEAYPSPLYHTLVVAILAAGVVVAVNAVVAVA